MVRYGCGWDFCFEKLFNKNELPDSWDASKCKVTYNMLTEIFFFMEQQSISWTFLIPILNLLCGSDISNKIKVPSNFQRKMTNFMKNKKNAEKLSCDVSCLYDEHNHQTF